MRSSAVASSVGGMVTPVVASGSTTRPPPRLKTDQFIRIALDQLGIASAETKLQLDVLQPVLERADQRRHLGMVLPIDEQHAKPPDPGRLRRRRQRRGCCRPHHHEKFASPHW